MRVTHQSVQMPMKFLAKHITKLLQLAREHACVSDVMRRYHGRQQLPLFLQRAQLQFTQSACAAGGNFRSPDRWQQQLSTDAVVDNHHVCADAMLTHGMQVLLYDVQAQITNAVLEGCMAHRARSSEGHFATFEKRVFRRMAGIVAPVRVDSRSLGVGRLAAWTHRQRGKRHIRFCNIPFLGDF